jgi:hypothetical protein
MRVKKVQKNKYIISEDGIWVRDMCQVAKKIDINNLYEKEKKIWLENEMKNLSKDRLDFNNNLIIENIIICSDGYKWKEKQKIIGSIPNSLVKVIGTNGSLSKWEMVGDNAEIKRVMSFYVANNPYGDCIGYLPKNHNYYPNIVASTRTYPEFIQRYKNSVCFYKPSSDMDYSGPPDLVGLTLDDYRNPICAAISFAYELNVKKLILFCCDDSFEEERSGAIKMDNGLYQYPQQIMLQKIIDKQLYWLRQNNVEIFDHSSGIKYENAGYISEDDITSFFQRSVKNE